MLAKSSWGCITQPNLTHRNVRLEPKPGPQRGIKDVHCLMLGKAPFSYNHICLHANFSFRCHAVNFLWPCLKRFLNFLNDRSTEPTNLVMLKLTCQVTDSSLMLAFKDFLLTRNRWFVRLVFTLLLLTVPLPLPCPPPTLARPLQSWMFNSPSLFCKGAC